MIETLKGEVGGDFSEILIALFEPPALYDALSCKKAIQVSPSIIQTDMLYVYVSYDCRIAGADPGSEVRGGRT